MEKPNILFIQVDQLSALALNLYGDKVSHTPELNRLGGQGAVFENAYCNFPLCAPSRFSMASGQLCSTIGAYDNAAEFPAEIPTYAHYLRGAGYHTCLSGKMHFIGPDQHHGFEQRVTADLYPADFSWVPHWGDEGKRDTNDPRSVLVSGVCGRSKQIEFDEEVTQQAVEYLYGRARGDDDRPFFLQVSYTHPHEPYLCKQEFWDLYEDRPVPPPITGPLSEEEHDPHAVRLLKDFGMFGVAFKEEDIQRARRAYYGSVSYIDSLISRLVGALKDVGEDQRTVIVFTSDHGDMLGERGMWFKKHFYEHSLRVPLIIHAPWIKQQRIAELASLVDLLPTFNGLAAGTPWMDNDEELAGMDLTALLNSGSFPKASSAREHPFGERAVYAEYLAEATPAPMFMIRRGQYKFYTSSSDGNFLYDLDKDPNERSNLAGVSEYQTIVERFFSEANEKWDAPLLTEQILTSQRRRSLVLAANRNGTEVRWNHDETPGQPVPWYRGHGGYNEWAFDFTPAGE